MPIVRLGSFVPRLTCKQRPPGLCPVPEQLVPKPVPIRWSRLKTTPQTCPTLVLVHPLPGTIDGNSLQTLKLW
jgi:hypothetical protein